MFLSVNIGSGQSYGGMTNEQRHQTSSKDYFVYKLWLNVSLMNSSSQAGPWTISFMNYRRSPQIQTWQLDRGYGPSHNSKGIQLEYDNLWIKVEGTRLLSSAGF